MFRINPLYAMAAVFLTIGTTDGMEDGKAGRNLPAEFKVLEHYVGSWTVDIAAPDPLAKGTARAEWILDGRFVQQNSEVASADGATRVKFTVLLTYDPIRKKYRRWAFVSDGVTSEGEGTWDAATRTMTFVTRDAQIGTTMTMTEDLSVDGIESWRMVNTDRAGQILFQRSGKNKRQK